MPPLNETQIKNLQPRDKPYKQADQSGLYLEILPTGTKVFRIKYRIDGKEKRLTVGQFPDVRLNEARRRLLDAKDLLAKGIDPMAKAAPLDTFADVAEAWLKVQRSAYADRTYDKYESLLRRDLLPPLGNKPINTITPVQIIAVLQLIQVRSLETGHKCLNIIRMIFRYALALGLIPSNPALDLRFALKKFKNNHRPALLKPEEIGQFLRAVDSLQADFIVIAALKLQAMLFVRPGELRAAKWQDVDLKAGLWSYHITKTDTAHTVPLSKQAGAILAKLKLRTGNGQHVFSIRGDRPLSENTLSVAIGRMGYSSDQVVPHGFRATFRTLGDEVLKFRVDLIEHQLGHAVKDPNGRAYNRTSFIDERRAMMQTWSDYLDDLKDFSIGKS